MKSFLFSLLICFFGYITPAAALEIQDIRFGVHPDKTRLVIELDQPTNFKSFVLPKEQNKPYRLVVDFPDFVWKAGTVKRPSKVNVIDVRTGTLKNGLKRVVIDLEKPPVLNAAFLLGKKAGKPDRLVIDFKTVSTTAFQSTARKAFGNLKTQQTRISAPQKVNDDAPLTQLIKTFQTTETKTKKTLTQTGSVIPVPSKKPAHAQSAPNKAKTPLHKKIIVVDAGHGGNDPGAIGAGHLKEKHITLAAARELKKQLEKTGRFTVHLTRDNDRYIKLYKRVTIARQRKADLFISLHADSIDKPNVRGASIYTLSNKASDAQTAKLAARENQSDLIAGVDLSHEDKEVADILLDLAMRDTMNQSKFFANTVVNSMRARGIRILQRPHRYAGFAVLKAPDVPSVLFEMGFMSNKGEARLLSTPEHRRKIASALVDSIETYFKKLRQNGLQ